MSLQAEQGRDSGPPSEKPCSQMPCSLSQRHCTTSSGSHGDAASYFLSMSAFVGPVFLFFSSDGPSRSRVLCPMSPRTLLEVPWRKPEPGSCAATSKYPSNLKTPREASEGVHPTIPVTRTTKKPTERTAWRPFLLFEPSHSERWTSVHVGLWRAAHPACCPTSQAHAVTQNNRLNGNK